MLLIGALIMIFREDWRVGLALTLFTLTAMLILLRVREKSGADALNATLTLEVAGRRVRRDVVTAFGYLASHDPRVHVGLGAVQRVDGVLVRWVDGTSERFGPFPAGKLHELRRGQGTPP